MSRLWLLVALAPSQGRPNRGGPIAYRAALSSTAVSHLDETAAEVVKAQPNPPRRISLWPLMVRSYRNRTGLSLVGAGLLLGVPATAAGILAEGPGWMRAAFILFCASFTLLILSTPAIGALRVYRALRHGIRVPGVILAGQWTPPDLRPATVDAATNGMTLGIRRVMHPLAAFEERFECDSSWAPLLKSGIDVSLLADPARPRVLFDLGPVHQLPEVA